MRKALLIFTCISLIFTTSVPAMATQNNMEYYDSREPLTTESDSEENISESIELEHGTLYVEENTEFRIAYLIYNDGHMDYSICYKNNPGVAHTGYYYPNEDTAQYAANDDIVSTLLNMEPEKVVDFSARPQSRATVLTEEDAIRHASDWADGWMTPVTLKNLGSYTSGGITATVYEAVNGHATEECVVNYYVNDTITSLVSIFFKFNTTKLLRVVSNVLNASGDYVAQKNGTLTYFTVDNTRTKTARINGKTNYWAGWDKFYGVYSGDKGTRVEPGYELAHSDYHQSVSYFGQKAIDNYKPY